MATLICKRNKIAIGIKKPVIETSAKKSHKELSIEFGLPKQSIQNIVQNKTTILKPIEEGRIAKRARLTPRMHEKMEKVLIFWIKQVRSQNLPLSGGIVKIFRKKTKEISAVLSIIGFEGSEGWMTNFEQRHGIHFKSNQEKAAGIDVGSLVEWKRCGGAISFAFCSPLRGKTTLIPVF
uniref:HTH CENPB-type domain-containing protein n=1 Tax=Ditylenchus dipsaci TaxID=166011 RepID=A0A915DKK1_9BILA